MQRIHAFAVAGLLGALAASPCLAQDATTVAAATPDTAIMESAPLSVPAPAAACCALADGTPVVLELVDPIGSARSQRGDRFRIRLREAVVVDGAVVLPAGIEGVGEVVHAERSRGGGKPGELLLAARHLQLGGRTIRLRGFKLGGSGRDTSHIALGTAMAIGPFAQFIHGKEIEIPALAQGSAKLGETLQLAPFLPAPEAGTPAPASEPAPADHAPHPPHDTITPPAIDQE